MTRRHQALLALLADGALHSGADLATQLGVSRAAVWKIVGDLREHGVDVESLPRSGSRLPRPVELLDAARIGGKFDRPGWRLDDRHFHLLWIPPGFAHGFCVMSERVHVEYKCNDFYDPADELKIAWDDPEIAIRWPVVEPVLSATARAAPRLRDAFDQLPEYGV